MENWMYALDLLLSYGMTGYILFKFMFEFFEPKYEKKIYILSWTMYVILTIFFNMTGIAFLKSIFGILSTCLIGLFLFNGPSKKKIIGISVFFFLYIFIIDALSVLLFTVFTGRTIEVVRSNIVLLFICGLGNQIMLICFYKSIVVILKKNKFDLIALQQNLFLVLVALFEVVLLIYIMSFIDTTSSGFALALMVLGFLGLDTYLIYLFESLSQKYQLEREINLREQQEIMQNAYYKSIESQYDNSRRLIHDMKNHMQTLEQLYKTDNGIEAGKYAHTIYELMNAMGTRFKCDNRVLTIILNDKILKCDEKKIEVGLEIGNLDINFIDSFDITTIFSNLLDNAIEACDEIKSSTKKIDIQMFQYKEFLAIKIKNTSILKISRRGNEFYTTKGNNHMGLGLKNVVLAVQKYNGSIYYKSEKNVFEVKILLPL